MYKGLQSINKQLNIPEDGRSYFQPDLYDGSLAEDRSLDYNYPLIHGSAYWNATAEAVTKNSTWAKRSWKELNGGFSNSVGPEVLTKCVEQAKKDCGGQPSGSGPTALINFAKCTEEKAKACKQAAEKSQASVIDQSGTKAEDTKPPTKTGWFQRNQKNLIIGSVVLALGVTGIILYKKFKK